MTDNDGPEIVNLDELSDDDKNDLIIRLSQTNNSLLDLAVTMQNSMVLFSLQLDKGNRFGRRGEAMRSVSIKSRIISAYALRVLGVDLEKIEQDAKFEDIVSGLDLDGDG